LIAAVRSTQSGVQRRLLRGSGASLHAKGQVCDQHVGSDDACLRSRRTQHRAPLQPQLGHLPQYPPSREPPLSDTPRATASSASQCTSLFLLPSGCARVCGVLTRSAGTTRDLGCHQPPQRSPTLSAPRPSWHETHTKGQTQSRNAWHHRVPRGLTTSSPVPTHIRCAISRSIAAPPPRRRAAFCGCTHARFSGGGGNTMYRRVSGSLTGAHTPLRLQEVLQG
jgi:hypothetical protein